MKCVSFSKNIFSFKQPGPDFLTTDGSSPGWYRDKLAGQLFTTVPAGIEFAEGLHSILFSGKTATKHHDQTRQKVQKPEANTYADTRFLYFRIDMYKEHYIYTGQT